MGTRTTATVTVTTDGRTFIGVTGRSLATFDATFTGRVLVGVWTSSLIGGQAGPPIPGYVIRWQDPGPIVGATPGYVRFQTPGPMGGATPGVIRWRDRSTLT